MAIFDLFSKRQKRLQNGAKDVYIYDTIPAPLKVQIAHLWFAALGKPEQISHGQVFSAYKGIVEALCQEYGYYLLPSELNAGLVDRRSRQYMQELVNFFETAAPVEIALDVIELSFRVIDRMTREYEYLHREDADAIATDVISQLNTRFKEHGLGYQYSDGKIIRIDSDLIHAEIVMPALQLLNRPGFSGVQDEFLKANEHYRHGNAKESLNECLKSFESMMKAICAKRNWVFDSKAATAKHLIAICYQNELIPSFWQASFASLRSMLESSVPTGRNKLGGHGQGPEPVAVPNYLVGYMIHMTAACIVFLGEADRAMK